MTGFYCVLSVYHAHINFQILYFRWMVSKTVKKSEHELQNSLSCLQPLLWVWKDCSVWFQRNLRCFLFLPKVWWYHMFIFQCGKYLSTMMCQWTWCSVVGIGNYHEAIAFTANIGGNIMYSLVVWPDLGKYTKLISPTNIF